MAATPTNKVSNTHVLKEYFQAHGADVKAWPKGWKQAVADRTGGTLNAIGAARSRMARTWLTDTPHLQVVPDPEPSPAAPKFTQAEAKALQKKRALDKKRVAGIWPVRTTDDLPEGFRHWGDHAHKLVPSEVVTWTQASGSTVVQLRPETPPIDKEGRPMKYLFPKGCGGVVGVVAGSEQTVLDPSVPLLIVEGTYQGRAVATALEGSESKFAVVQVSGCNGWMTGGEPAPEFWNIPLRGREVFFLPDADVRTNRGVYDAAQYLRENLLGEFLARQVQIIHLPGRGNDGADDLLSRHDHAHNLEMVLQWIEMARGPEGKLGKPPRKRRRDSGFFNAEGNFQPATFWEHLRSHHHLALNGDKSIAVYEGGVYLNSDSRRWNKAVEQALGNFYVPQYFGTTTDLALTSLKTSGLEVPQFLSEPLLNVKNGLVDLRTGELLEHTHEVVTLQQLPVEWDPKATCPTWEWLINSALPGQIERLEDVISQCIDWTQAPVKILILYGEARAGKGLILRVILWLLGANSCSAVTLHQLAENRFMAAELFGKRANVAGELKPDEVKDISLVKMLTGEDPIQADKKYGQTFSFFNYAFLAFSCNKLPPINETTKAFSSRVSPFRFTVGHSGTEDRTLGDKLKAELPGILVRLVQAWQRRQERGNFIATDEATAEHFNENIDHVARFIHERTVPVDNLRDGIKRAELFNEFQLWCAEENLTMVARGSRNTFFEKVRNNGGQDGKDSKGINRWRYRVRRPGDNDQERTATSGGPNGGSGAVNGSAISETAVPKPGGATGEVKAERQQRQKLEKNSEINSGPPSNQTLSENRYGQGCSELPLVPLSDLPSDDLIRPGSADPLVIDLETRSASELWATPNGSGPFIRLVGTDHGNNTDPSQLLDHTGPLVAHNGFGFDFLSLARHHDLPLLELSESGRLVDTMVLALALDPPADGGMSGGQLRRHFSLDNCATRAGIEGKTDDLGKLARSAAKDAGHKGKPSELQALGYGLIPQADPDYNAYLRGDIAAGRGVFDALVPTGELDDYSRREMRVMGRLAAGITLAGTRLDVELTRKRFDQIERTKEACRQILVERFNLPTTTSTGRSAKNPLSCNGAAEAITAAANALGLELPTTPKTGKPSTSKDNLGPLLEQAKQEGNDRQAAFLETILGLTGARSVYGTALDHLQSDGRIHPTIAPLQASGRFSITQPGITVFGKRGGKVIERAIFLPDADDHVLIAADLSQIDMRAIAAHAQDPAYMELFAPGRDAHSEVAAAVGLTRSDAKAIGHGWNYGMSVKGMVRHGIEEAKAVQFDRGMRRSFPNLCRWRDRVRDRAERGHKLDNGFGRLMKANPQRAYTQAPALMGQGTARDLMMEAVLRLPLWLVPQLRFLVHDELVFSVPRNRWITAGKEILRAMTFEWAPPGASLSIRVTGDLSRPGRNWADCYRQKVA